LISIGLILDKANSHRRVDRSNEPASSDDATGGESAFKSFWGKKCELRRFQDGSIVEAVVWDLAPTSLGGSSNVPKGEFIVEQVVRYILGQHLANWAGERGERIINPQASLTASLARASYHGAGTVQKSDPRWRFDNETLTRKAVECVDNLRNLICSELKGPPLHVEALNSITDALRYTSVHPPMPHPFLMGADTIKEFSGVNVSLQTRPILLVGTLESSSKWPEDEDAFEHSLTGFIIAISDALRTQHQVRNLSAFHM
jgi:U3 small nucleolar RNA-associated protein 22